MKMIKRAVSMLLVLCIVLSVAPISALAVLPSYIWDVLQKSDTLTVGTEAVNPFTDISGSDWYYDDVMYVRANGFFNGTSATTFDPDGTMTRGMFVTVLGRMAGVDAAAYAGVSDFSDVSVDQYYAPYVAWASKHGVTTGTGGGKFSPDELIDRQQLATFLVRYFEAFDVIYNSGSAYVDDPADIDSTEDWAKDSVSKLWSAGIMHGTNGKAAPGDDATRAWTASVCHRADLKVSVWYKEPGVRSSRVSIDPAADMSGDIVLEGGSAPAAGSDFVINLEPDKEEEEEIPYEDKDIKFWLVRFYDGDRLIDKIPVLRGTPLNKLPDVEKSSKAEHVLVGYYLDPEFTQPFFAGERVTKNLKVYAKYEEMERQESLNFTSFARMDQSPNAVYYIRWTKDSTPDVAPVSRVAVLEAKDGTDPVEIQIVQNSGNNYRIVAPDGYNEGSTYELTLADGWVFVGDDGKDMAETIRTATFSIAMKQVENLRMGTGIKYIKDTAAITYSVGEDTYDILTSDCVTGEGTFKYPGTGVVDNAADENVQDDAFAVGDIICIYTGTKPTERKASDGVANGDEAVDGTELLDPAVYVKVTNISGDIVTFAPLGEADQQKLYEIADNFPFYVSDGKFADYAKNSNTVDLDTFFNAYFDESVYGLMISETTLLRDTMVDKAKSKVSVDDFITIYSELPADGDEPQEGTYYYGKITSIEDGKITYIKQTEEDINSSMDLYSKVDLNDDLLTDEELGIVQAQIYEQVLASDFGEEAAELMAETAIRTEGFRENMAIENFLVANSIEDLKYAIDDVNIDVSLSKRGRNFKGTSFIITVNADVIIPLKGQDYISLDLSAEFEQEIYLDTSVKGSIVTKEILFIPVPVGVHVDVSLDIKNFTGFDFDAEVCTYSGYGELLEQINVSDELDEMMETAEAGGVSDGYFDAFDELLNRFKNMLEKETDWVTLVEKSLFEKEIFVYGLVVGIECDFVVRTDMSIAIGSNFEYQVGKRYIFWFEIGLFKPTAGSETVDLMDESFAFRFYVLGKMGVRAGIKAKLYAGIGSGKLANVGIAAELGPYVKLYGIFLYENTRFRPKNSTNWQESETMMGALCTEMGMYFVLSFEAEALSLFEYSYEFVNKEYPLLYGGDRRYYYEFAYEPERDEQVVVRDHNGDSSDGISMEVPYSAIAMTYVDLMTGIIGTAAETRGDYIYSVSNPNFSVSKDGIITVKVPEYTRFMECDLTVTYKHSKLAFSNYDMTATIPLVWTNLSLAELNEYYTASVQVGNAIDGYETVWSKRVLKNQPFSLPTEEEIKELIGWNELVYDEAKSTGYNGLQLNDLTIIQDEPYRFNVEYREYQLTVTGIENEDGSIGETKYFARFGEAFKFTDFSADEKKMYFEKTKTEIIDLYETGTEIVDSIDLKREGIVQELESQILNKTYKDDSVYTKFAKLTTTATVEINGKEVPLDLYQPINETMAEALINNVEAKATYVDDSVSAIFCFSGVPYPDVVMKTRRDTELDSTKYSALEKVVYESSVSEDLSIAGTNPELGVINSTTLFTVKCFNLTGERYTIYFDENYAAADSIGATPDTVAAKGYESDFVFDLENITRMQGGYIGPIHQPTRIGYTFAGWYEGESYTVEGENGETITKYDRIPLDTNGKYKTDRLFTTQNMPGHDVTLFAKWIPKAYTVSFNLFGGETLQYKSKGVIYDADYSHVFDSENYSLSTALVYDEDGQVVYDSSDGITKVDLPTAAWTGAYRFKGWLTEPKSIPYYDDAYYTSNNITKPVGDYYNSNKYPGTNASRVDKDTRVSVADNNTVYAEWRELIAIPKELFDFGGRENSTYNTKKQYAAYTYNENDLTFTDTDGERINYPELDTFGVGYKVNSDGGRFEEYAMNADEYMTKISRPADDYFRKFEYTWSGVLKIDKASSAISSSPSVASQYYANIIPSAPTSYTGDGAFEYAVTTTNSAPSADSSKWTKGVVYNVCDGNSAGTGSTLYLWVRLAEGRNYLQSEPYGGVEFTLKNGAAQLISISGYSYKLTIHTSGEDNSGTDAGVFARVGDGEEKKLNKSGNDFEKNDTDTYDVNAGGNFPNSMGTIPTTIRFNHVTAQGWRLGWLRLDVYKDNECIITGAQYDANEWYGSDRSKTYNLTGYERNVNPSQYNLPTLNTVELSSSSSGTISASINGTLYDDTWKREYDFYQHKNAPNLVASFDDYAAWFDKYITWTGVNSFKIDEAKLFKAMNDYAVPSITLTYGVKYVPCGDDHSVVSDDRVYTKTVTITADIDIKDADSKNPRETESSADAANVVLLEY